jgi:hypothetical protein
MHCDEVWDYTTNLGTAALVRLRALCPACDLARHFGRANRVGKGDVALRQWAKVNDTDTIEATEHQIKLMQRFQVLSVLPWTISVSDDLVAQYPALKQLVGVQSVEPI